MTTIIKTCKFKQQRFEMDQFKIRNSSKTNDNSK